MGRADKRASDRAKAGKRIGGGRTIKRATGVGTAGSKRRSLAEDAKGAAEAARGRPQRPSGTRRSPVASPGGATSVTADGSVRRTSLALLRNAVTAKRAAQGRVDRGVARARAEGHTWAEIAAVLGITTEGARKRYREGAASGGADEA